MFHHTNTKPKPLFLNTKRNHYILEGTDHCLCILNEMKKTLVGYMVIALSISEILWYAYFWKLKSKASEKHLTQTYLIWRTEDVTRLLYKNSRKQNGTESYSFFLSNIFHWASPLTLTAKQFKHSCVPTNKPKWAKNSLPRYVFQLLGTSRRSLVCTSCFSHVLDQFSALVLE